MKTIYRTLDRAETPKLRPRKLSWILVGAFALYGALAPRTVNAQWLVREVYGVNGSWLGIQPTFGNEVGEGSDIISWGDPFPGSFRSSLAWLPWLGPPQLVFPGQSFVAGYVTFGNGDLRSSSSATSLSVHLLVEVLGYEFFIDNHFLQVFDDWRVAIRQTPNTGDLYGDADYIFLPDFPQLGSFRVFEGGQTTVPILARFGSVEPVAFGDPVDGNGFVVPSIVNDPFAPGVPEPSTLVLALGSAAMLCGGLYVRLAFLRTKKAGTRVAF